MIEKIKNKMKERSFTLYAHNPDNTWLSFSHLNDPNNYISCTGIFCDIYIKEEIEFRFTYLIPKSIFLLDSIKLGAFFNDEHFNKMLAKFILTWDKLQGNTQNKEPSLHRKYSPEFLQEYSDIMKAGFKGTIEEYIFYKNNYGKNQNKQENMHEFELIPDDDIPF